MLWYPHAANFLASASVRHPRRASGSRVCFALIRRLIHILNHTTTYTCNFCTFRALFSVVLCAAPPPPPLPQVSHGEFSRPFFGPLLHEDGRRNKLRKRYIYSRRSPPHTCCKWYCYSFVGFFKNKCDERYITEERLRELIFLLCAIVPPLLAQAPAGGSILPQRS